jgi:hypothetical protein
LVKFFISNSPFGDGRDLHPGGMPPVCEDSSIGGAQAQYPRADFWPVFALLNVVFVGELLRSNTHLTVFCATAFLLGEGDKNVIVFRCVMISPWTHFSAMGEGKIALSSRTH